MSSTEYSSKDLETIKASLETGISGVRNVKTEIEAQLRETGLDGTAKELLQQQYSEVNNLISELEEQQKNLDNDTADHQQDQVVSDNNVQSIING